MKCLFVAVIYLVSLVTTSSAQVVGAASARLATKSGQTTASGKKASKSGPDTNLQATLNTQVQAAVKKAEDQQDDTYWVNKGAAMVEKECNLQGLPCILGKLFEAEKAANYDIEKAVVCLDDGSECVAALAYGQGAVHYALNNLLYYNGQLIVESSPDFVELVSNYLVHTEKDRQAAMKYLQQVYNAGDCSFKASELLPPGGWTQSQQADSRMRQEARQKRCVVEMSVLPTMAMLAKTQAEKDYVTKKSAKLLDKGAGWTGTAMTALGILGTAQAYKVVEEFLDDQLPSRLGNAMQMLDSPGKTIAREGLKKTSVARGGNSNYLTRITKTYQYHDAEEINRQGLREVPQLGGADPYPQGNYLEDVGYMLASQSFENVFAGLLAKRLVTRANQETKAGINTHGKAADVTYPVIVGILDGWRQGKDKKFIYEPSQELLSFLYKGDWFDLNEATQRRVHYKAYQFAKARGWGWKAPEKDLEKLKRDQENNAVLAVGKSVDVVYQVYMLVGLAKLAVVKGPQLARGVKLLKTRQGRLMTKNYIRKLPRTISKKAATAYQNTKQAVKNAPAAISQRVQQVKSGVTKGKETVASEAQTVAAETVSQGATTSRSAVPAANEAVAKPVELGPAKPRGVAAETPTTSAVSPTQLQQQVTGPLAQRVQEGKSATDNIKAGTKYVGGAIQDYFKALARPTNTLQMSFPGLPGPGFLQNWRAIRAERLVQASNFIKAEPLDASRRIAYYVGKDGKVAKQVISETKYQKLVGSASQADTRTWAIRQLKYKHEIQALDNPNPAPGVEIVSRGTGQVAGSSVVHGEPGIEIVKRKQPPTTGNEPVSSRPVAQRPDPLALEKGRATDAANWARQRMIGASGEDNVLMNQATDAYKEATRLEQEALAARRAFGPFSERYRSLERRARAARQQANALIESSQRATERLRSAEAMADLSSRAAQAIGNSKNAEEALRIKELQIRISGLEVKIKQLQSRKEGLQTSLEFAERNYQSSVNRYNGLRYTTNYRAEQRAGNDISMALEKIDTYERELESVSQEINSLQQQYQAARQEFNMLEQSVSTM